MLEKAKEILKLKAESESLADSLKAVNTKWLQVEESLLEDMAEEGVGSFKLDSGEMFTMASENYFSLRADAKPDFFEWMKANGHGALIKEDVNAQTLKAFLKTEFANLVQKAVLVTDDALLATNKVTEMFEKLGASHFKKRSLRVKKG